MNLLEKLLHGPVLGKSFCSCAPSPPPAPDTRGAAREQGQANIDAAINQGKINNPNVYGPYGSQTVTWNGNQPTINQQLSSQQQQLLNTGTQAKIGLSDLALQGTNLARNVLDKPLDMYDLPQRPGSAEDTRTKVLDAMMGRVNEDADRREKLMQSNLAASGIGTNTDAYRDAMALQGRQRNDAATQAYLASGQEMTRDFQTDTQRRRDALGEKLTERQNPINEITALMSGSQVSNPFSMPGVAQNGQVGAAPIFAAQNALTDYNTDVYNAQAAGAAGQQQGMIGLGTTALMAAAMM